LKEVVIGNNMQKGISVIICCYNSELRLPETLKHLASQNVDDCFSWEVIVVDNNSTDNTSGFALKEWEKYNTITPLKVVEEKKPGLAKAREKGVREAKFEYVIFCDDDNWLDSKYLVNTLKLFESDLKIGAIGGQGFPVSDIDLPDWFYNYLGSYACGPQAKYSGFVTNNRNYLYGAGLAFRTHLLLEIYQNDTFILSGRKGKALSSGEDSELTMNVALKGYELHYDETLTFKHYIPRNRVSIQYLEKLHKAFGNAHYHLYPLQLQIIQKLNKPPKYPAQRVLTIMRQNFKNILFYLLTKKHFSGTIKGAWALGVISESIKQKIVSVSSNK
jgi:glycosyltransferase involved in cell wall biosynthesis